MRADAYPGPQFLFPRRLLPASVPDTFALRAFALEQVVVNFYDHKNSTQVQVLAKVLFPPPFPYSPIPPLFSFATMNNPFSFLAMLPAPPTGLGEQLAQAIARRPRIDSLLACLPSTPQPAILSTSLSRPPLTHAQLRRAVATFRLPSSSPNVPLGRNDRVAVVLPTGPEVRHGWCTVCMARG